MNIIHCKVAALINDVEIWRLRVTSMANTRKEVLESNDRYRKNFLSKNTRLHLVNDYDLIQAIEESKDIESFNSLTIRLLREHFGLDSSKYLINLEKNIQEKVENYRKAIALYWNDKDNYEENVEAINKYLQETYNMAVGNDVQSQTILKTELKYLGKLDEK